MQNGILLEQENKELGAANAAQKQKRAPINRHLAHEAGISVQEVQEHLQACEPIIQPTALSPAAPAQPIQRAAAPARPRQFTCSLCNQVEHRANQCNQTWFSAYKGVLV